MGKLLVSAENIVVQIAPSYGIQLKGPQSVAIHQPVLRISLAASHNRLDIL